MDAYLARRVKELKKIVDNTAIKEFGEGNDHLQIEFEEHINYRTLKALTQYANRRNCFYFLLKSHTGVMVFNMCFQKPYKKS